MTGRTVLALAQGRVQLPRYVELSRQAAWPRLVPVLYHARHTAEAYVSQAMVPEVIVRAQRHTVDEVDAPAASGGILIDRASRRRLVEIWTRLFRTLRRNRCAVGRMTPECPPHRRD